MIYIKSYLQNIQNYIMSATLAICSITSCSICLLKILRVNNINTILNDKDESECKNDECCKTKNKVVTELIKHRDDKIFEAHTWGIFGIVTGILIVYLQRNDKLFI